MATYYVSANGCDNNDGLSPSTAWRTIKKVNSSIKGGDAVCFKRGETFFGQILPPKQNSSSAPTTYTSYGEGAVNTRRQKKARGLLLATGYGALTLPTQANLTATLPSSTPTSDF